MDARIRWTNEAQECKEDGETMQHGLIINDVVYMLGVRDPYAMEFGFVKAQARDGDECMERRHYKWRADPDDDEGDGCMECRPRQMETKTRRSVYVRTFEWRMRRD